MKPTRHDLIVCAVLALGCVLLAFVRLPAGRGALGASECARARVLSTDNSQVRTNLVVLTDYQYLTARVLDGPHRGSEVTVENLLTGKMEYDEAHVPGQTILVEYDAGGTDAAGAQARGVYRLHLQAALIGLFAALLLAVAGWTGLKALLSFVLTGMALWKVYFPLLLRGQSPIPIGFAMVAVLTGIITLAVGGLNRRGAATFIGSMLGIGLTALLAMVFTKAFALNGAIRPFSESLLYSGYTNLDLSAIFVSSVFLASSGAVMDLAMDVAAAMDEIKRQNPRIGFWNHMAAGLRVGRAVVGTMTTTLLLAYSGSHVTMFMLFLGKGLLPERILNAPLVASEILNILIGSFGLVTVAPFTALVAAWLYRRTPAEGTV